MAKGRTNGAFKIEPGIPIPVRKTSGLLSTLRMMNVGESMLVGDIPRSSLSATASSCKPLRFVTRMTPEGLRIWRTE